MLLIQIKASCSTLLWFLWKLNCCQLWRYCTISHENVRHKKTKNKYIMHWLHWESPFKEQKCVELTVRLCTWGKSHNKDYYDYWSAAAAGEVNPFLLQPRKDKTNANLIRRTFFPPHTVKALRFSYMLSLGMKKFSYRDLKSTDWIL